MEFTFDDLSTLSAPEYSWGPVCPAQCDTQGPMQGCFPVAFVCLIDWVFVYFHNRISQ